MGLEKGRSFAERIKNLTLEEKIQKEIFETGLFINSNCEFMERASIAAKVITKENMPNLIKYLANPMERASYFRSRFVEDREYNSVIHDAVFEILYNFKADSIPYLKEMILDSDVAMSIKAMKTLCRFAQASIEKDDIIIFIDENIDDLRYEVIIPTFYFLTFIKNSSTVLDIFDRYFCLYNDDSEEYADALYVLENIYKYDEFAIDPYIHYLKEYALNKNFRDRPNLEGIVIRNIFGDDTDEINFCFNESVGEMNNIRAALFYSKIVPNDEEIHKSLTRWYNSNIDLTLKNKIEVYLRKFSSVKGG